MKKSLLTYLRSSALLRAFSALAFVGVTGSSVIAGECSSCSMSSQNMNTQSSTESGGCHMSQGAQSKESASLVDVSAPAKESSCCCSKPATKPEPVKQKPLKQTPLIQKASLKSCCATDGSNSDDPNTKATLEADLSDRQLSVLVSMLEFSTSSQNPTCNHAGSCQNQIQEDTNSTSPPPLRSVEQERQDNLKIQIQLPETLLAQEQLESRAYNSTIVLSNSPPSLSGIGSLLLRC